MNKILIIDDDIDLCNLLKKQLKREGYDIVDCYDGEIGYRTFLNNRFELIILDVMLPKKNGFDVLSEIRKTSHIPVLMLTSKDLEIDKVTGLRLGADDYLTKPFSIFELLARVQSLIRRYTVFNQNKEEEVPDLSFKGLFISSSLREIKVNNKSIRLTAKEFDLLYFLASNQGKIYTREQLYRNVWKDEYCYDDNNIMSFISKLRKKIKNESMQIDYIETIHGVGYRFNLEV